jgi:hypothetical protein
VQEVGHLLIHEAALDELARDVLGQCAPLLQSQARPEQLVHRSGLSHRPQSNTGLFSPSFALDGSDRPGAFDDLDDWRGAEEAAKPFCASGPLDHILIQGPVDIRFHVTLTDEGEYHSEQEATGLLTVLPINPLTMEPTGPPVDARVRERQKATLSDGTAWGESVVRHIFLGDPEQFKFQKLRVGNQERYVLDINCGK